MLMGMVIVMAAAALPIRALAADGQLPTATRQKAALQCQKLVARVTAKVVGRRYQALDACGNAALVCVQTKPDQLDVCLRKTSQTCAKKLGAAQRAVVKAETKITTAKSCAVKLRFADLLAGDGLGFGAIGDRCRADLDLNICGLPALAQCLVETHDRQAAELYGVARPRAANLLAALPVASPKVAGLPDFGGCGTCASDEIADRALVEHCGKSLTKALLKLTTTLSSQLGACTQQVFACIEGKAGAPTCTAQAVAACSKRAGGIATAFDKFAAAVEQACGAGVIDFARLRVPEGLNLDALAEHCTAVGTTAPTSAATLATCLARRSACTVGGLVQEAIARTPAFAATDVVGTLGDELTDTCPALHATAATAARDGARGIFGSIVKFIRQIGRPHAGGTGVLKPNGKPNSSPGHPRNVTIRGRPGRVRFGGITKIPFSYRLGTFHASSQRLAADPPTLIVVVQRQGGTLDDHFEIPLDPPPGATEVDDDLAVVYADTLEECAFTLLFATRIDGFVSDYTPLLQIVDAGVAPPITERVSVAADGGPPDSESFFPTISPDGQLVAFESFATNLVAHDGNGVLDVFVRDRQAGATERVSIDSAGVEGNSDSFTIPVLSADGRIVAFESDATNLVPGDTNGLTDLFVHDRLTGVTERVNVDSNGVQANGVTPSYPGLKAALSADGRLVAFASDATNLVAGDTNAMADVFVRDRQTGSTERVSVDSFGAQADGDSLQPALSADGRFVSFSSPATNLVAGDTNGGADVFLHDRFTGTTERVSVDSAEMQVIDTNRISVYVSDLSDDGRFVAFEHGSEELVPGDSNEGQDIFVRDRLNTTTERITVSSDGFIYSDLFLASLSGDGRTIAFAHLGITQSELEVHRFYVHDRQTGVTEQVGFGNSGYLGLNEEPGFTLSADGRFVAFSSFVRNLVPGDTDHGEDVFVRGRDER